MFTAMGVYTGSSITNLTVVVGGHTQVTFEAQEGVTYQIWIDEYVPGVGGNIQLSLLLTTLRINLPANSTTFFGHTDLQISATATDLDGPFPVMNFLANGEVLGQASTSPYVFLWSNAPPGNYSLQVSVTNDAGVVRLSPSVAVSIRPTNDNFADRLPITGASNVITGYNINSTMETGEPAIAGGHSVWWTWTAPASGRATASTVGSIFWPVLGVFTGTNLDRLTLVTNSTAGPMGPTWDTVSFDIVADTPYQIAVASWYGEENQIRLAVTMVPTPSNNDYDHRAELTGFQAESTGNNFAANNEPREPLHAGHAGGHSVWWQWTAPASGWVELGLVAQNSMPLLAVYTGDVLTNLAGIAASNSNSLTFNATGGVSYVIAFDDDGLAGEFDLSLILRVPPENDAFSRRLALTGTNLQATGALGGATRETGEPGHAGHVGTRSVWWSWTAPSAGLVTLSLASDIWAPLLATYAGSTLSNLVPIASVAGSSVTFQVNAQTAYQIALDTADNLVANFILSLDFKAAPVNDDFLFDFVLTNNSARIEGNNVSASGEPNEPLLGGADSKTLWWSWTAPSNGTAIIAKQGLSAATTHTVQEFIFVLPPIGPLPPMPPMPPTPIPPFGQQSGPLVAVYTGNEVSNLSLIASNSFYDFGNWYTPAGWGALNQFYFPVVEGMTYHISVDSCQDSAGCFTLEFDFVPPPPNDAFSNRIALTGSNLSIQGYNFAASKEPGEPDHAAQSGGASVWWSWLAPESGRVTIDVSAPFTPLTAVYTGSTPNMLTSVVSGSTSVSFVTRAGLTYGFAFDAEGAAQGQFDWSLSMSPSPSNDLFASAISLVGHQILVAGSTINATREPGEPVYPGPTGEASVWYKWQAPADGHVALNLVYWPGFLAVYAGSTVSNLTLVSSSSRTDAYYDAEFYAMAGQTYYIAVTDECGNVGNFRFQLNAPPPIPKVASPISSGTPEPGFRLYVAGLTGQSFVLQASTNLVTWETVAIDTMQGEITSFMDMDTARFPHRFFRVVPLATVISPVRSPSRLTLQVGPTTGVTTGFTLRISGMAGQSFILRASSDLIHWEEVRRGWVVGDYFDFLDPDAASRPARFFQVVPLP
jgi:hypothetical protein